MLCLLAFALFLLVRYNRETVGIILLVHVSNILSGDKWITEHSWGIPRPMHMSASQIRVQQMCRLENYRTMQYHRPSLFSSELNKVINWTSRRHKAPPVCAHTIFSYHNCSGHSGQVLYKVTQRNFTLVKQAPVKELMTQCFKPPACMSTLRF